MLGGLFALLAAVTFAWTNAAVRRGVISGSATQATTLSVPVGIPVFFIALLVSGQPALFAGLSQRSTLVFAFVGVSHFIVGRYCNYRAIKAIGTNLAGPVSQFNLVVSLLLAVFFLGETLTVLRLIGILLIFASPLIARPNKSVPVETTAAPTFTPRLAEGYTFAFLSSLCYGASPPLVRYAVAGQGMAASLAGGVIASAAATIAVILLLFAPGHLREVAGVNRNSAKWFLFSGVMVYVSQIFAYMAVALAPVTITAPIIALNNVFRLHLSRWINPQHEVFGPEVLVATVMSFLGVVVLSLSADILPLPASWLAVLNWHWP